MFDLLLRFVNESFMSFRCVESHPIWVLFLSRVIRCICLFSFYNCL